MTGEAAELDGGPGDDAGAGESGSRFGSSDIGESGGAD
jgi:hypothetical protein